MGFKWFQVSKVVIHDLDDLGFPNILEKLHRKAPDGTALHQPSSLIIVVNITL
jgi:hypothetical protein